MNKNKLIRKSKTTDNKTDITRAFNNLSQNKNLYLLTLTGIPTTNVKDLNFQLTNNLFNTINADYKNSFEYINYLFIIEYGGIISKNDVSSSFIRNLGLHAHCIINTSLYEPQLEFYINTAFKKIPNYKIQNISNSTTKNGLLNYLLKQSATGLMTKESYNYKILI
ncbi:hypothetical protein [Mucilaginibacter gotjawali]|uniref:Uncharacterized protein n=1 Tax=Mucilaginibacter gotjawali TaxID=1550579 RepID=A0A839SJV2_9SPHI|nr:hypothetical protein [Mucilaginibacter gotjawali]MBB3056819.1 hypothetical protein [Mucilaginibacter gotjawali]